VKKHDDDEGNKGERNKEFDGQKKEGDERNI